MQVTGTDVRSQQAPASSPDLGSTVGAGQIAFTSRSPAPAVGGIVIMFFSGDPYAADLLN